jgi:3-hydroxyisobutyrate dehydrogenase
MSSIKMVESGKTTIGWIGTGIMGQPMCGHLMDAGYAAIVHTRSQEKAQPLLDKGATWADTPSGLVQNADVVFTMVGMPGEVRDVYFEEGGVLEACKNGQIIVDMTTTEPSLAKEIAEACAEKGAYAIDAPVSGGDVGAINGTLSIMVGGNKEAVDAVMPLLQIMGKTVSYMGEPGMGQHTKMCNQITLSGTMIGVAQALIYGAKAGLDLETLLAAISKGAAGCWVLDNLAPKMMVHDFEPGFYVEHYLKDLEIALRESLIMDLDLPGLKQATELYKLVMMMGHGRSGYHALLLALEKLSKTKVTDKK